MSAVLLNVGAIAAIWGILWSLWDHNADAPRYMLEIALAALFAGIALS